MSVRSEPAVERNDFLDSLSGYRSDSAIMPFEAIFVPSTDEEANAGAVDVVDSVFEDEEADDVFEQSLSGLKLDEDPRNDGATTAAELTDEVSDALAVQALPQFDEPPNISHPAEASVPRTPGEQWLFEHPVYEAPAAAGYGLTGYLVRVLLISLVALVGFGIGSLATIIFFELPPEIPQAVDFPVLASAAPSNLPPTGMVFVPGGEFLMGSDEGDAFSRPAHPVSVGPFYIDQTEVTNAAYYEFVKATDHERPRGWINGKYPDGKANFPVTGVTWYDAAEFAVWKGRRLPSEAEWEFAARGSDGRIYPWGNLWESSRANAAKTADGVREVGQGEESPFGLYDMAGNAWEWTSSSAKSFPNGREIPWSRLRLKIIRGGNWQSDERTTKTFFRGFYGAAGEKEYNGTGFRCVKDLPKE